MEALYGPRNRNARTESIAFNMLTLLYLKLLLMLLSMGCALLLFVCNART